VKLSFFINLQNGNDTAKPPNGPVSGAVADLYIGTDRSPRPLDRQVRRHEG